MGQSFWVKECDDDQVSPEQSSKSKSEVVIVFSFVFSFLIFLGQPVSVNTVENGQDPVHEKKIQFTEDLVLGPEKGADYIWVGANVSVSTDSSGNMFVLDEGNNRIIMFDPEGKVKRIIGGEGDGPGEFRKLRRFQILDDGSAIAFENKANPTLSFFDKDFNFLEQKSFSVGMKIISATFSSNGNWLGGKASFIDDESGREVNQFAIFDKDLQLKEVVLREYGPQFDQSRMEDPQYWEDYLAVRFNVFSKGLNGYVGFAPDGKIYTAQAHTYSVTRWNNKMEKELVINRNYKPVHQTEEEVMAIVEPIRDSILSQLPARFSDVISLSLLKRAVIKADFPPARTPVAGLIVMENGYLVVIHNLNYKTGTAQGDLFDLNGNFTGSFIHPNFGLRLSRMIFANGYAYTIENREEDENTLVRYKFTIE